jgi:hypothetical protein
MFLRPARQLLRLQHAVFSDLAAPRSVPLPAMSSRPESRDAGSYSSQRRPQSKRRDERQSRDCTARIFERHFPSSSGITPEPPTPTPDPAVQPEQPWVPPSRRHYSIVGQLGSSPPRPQQVYGTTPSQSPEMLSVEDYSRPNSEFAPAYPDQTPSASQLAWLLREQ